jgi:hypothetical protein
MGCLCDCDADSPNAQELLRIRAAQQHYPLLQPLTENLLYADRQERRRQSLRLMPGVATASEDDIRTGERH